MVVPGGGPVSYERGTPILMSEVPLRLESGRDCPMFALLARQRRALVCNWVKGLGFGVFQGSGFSVWGCRVQDVARV